MVLLLSLISMWLLLPVIVLRLCLRAMVSNSEVLMLNLIRFRAQLESQPSTLARIYALCLCAGRVMLRPPTIRRASCRARRPEQQRCRPRFRRSLLTKFGVRLRGVIGLVV